MGRLLLGMLPVYTSDFIYSVEQPHTVRAPMIHVKAPVHCSAELGGTLYSAPPQFGFRASVNSNYPIHLKIELASCHAFSSSNLHYFFHPKCFSPSLEQFLNRFLKIGAKVFQENQKPDISKCRGCKDPVPTGIMLLGYRTYIPVLGSS